MRVKTESAYYYMVGYSRLHITCYPSSAEQSLSPQGTQLGNFGLGNRVQKMMILNSHKIPRDVLQNGDL